MAIVKQQDKAEKGSEQAPDQDQGPVNEYLLGIKAKLREFKGYDLKKMGIPVQAWPLRTGTYLGKHGYTVKSASGGVLQPNLNQSVFVVDVFSQFQSKCLFYTNPICPMFNLCLTKYTNTSLSVNIE